jgi:hypothetical protein
MLDRTNVLLVRLPTDGLRKRETQPKRASLIPSLAALLFKTVGTGPDEQLPQSGCDHIQPVAGIRLAQYTVNL